MFCFRSINMNVFVKRQNRGRENFYVFFLITFIFQTQKNTYIKFIVCLNEKKTPDDTILSLRSF